METMKIERIPGFLYGQAQSVEGGTGCTVILCPEGAVTGVDVRGGSPSTRDTDALDPVCNRKVVHGVLLTGGSAFGLDAAGGVMKRLEEAKIGRDVSVTVVPNVCAAVLFDLKVGKSTIRPDHAMGYEACEAALRKNEFLSGCFGAGTGATVGKINGLLRAMKGGIGAVAFQQGDLMVGAVVAVNCVGDVLENGSIIAGCRSEAGDSFVDSERIFLDNYAVQKDVFSGDIIGGNTVIGCIITNADLTKAQAKKLAAIGQNGLARAIRPAHTIHDGDTMFAMSHGTVTAAFDAVGILAVRAVEGAIAQGVKSAQTMYGYPAACDVMTHTMKTT